MRSAFSNRIRKLERALPEPELTPMQATELGFARIPSVLTLEQLANLQRMGLVHNRLGVLLVPPTLSIDEWDRLAAIQQAELKATVRT